jgi:hypothetical protein
MSEIIRVDFGHDALLHAVARLESEADCDQDLIQRGDASPDVTPQSVLGLRLVAEYLRTLAEYRLAEAHP